MHSELESALIETLPVVARHSMETRVRMLRDDAIPVWAKTAVVQLFANQMKERGYGGLSVEMFSPLKPYVPTYFSTSTSIHRFVDDMLQSVSDELTPHLSLLLETYSPRGGEKDQRFVADPEIRRMIPHLDVEMLATVRSVLQHMCNVLSKAS